MCQTQGTQHSLLPWARLDPAQYFSGTTRKMGLGLGCPWGNRSRGQDPALPLLGCCRVPGQTAEPHSQCSAPSFPCRAVIPLYDADTGLLVLAGKVRSWGGGTQQCDPTPCLLLISAREKTSCTAWRRHRLSLSSPKVNRMHPTLGCFDPYSCPHPKAVLPVCSHSVPDGGTHTGPGHRSPPGPGRHGLRGAPRPAAHRHLPCPCQLHCASQGERV